MIRAKKVSDGDRLLKVQQKKTDVIVVVLNVKDILI